MEGMMGVILAGGQGRRMGVLCEERPKPVLPFAGRYSVIDFSLSNCRNSRIPELIALTDYKRHEVAEYLKHWEKTNGESPRLSVLPPQTHSYLGTADAVFQNLDLIDQSQAEMVLILAGDHIYKMDYRLMADFHREKNADVTVAVVPVPLHEAHRFGTVGLNSEARVTGFAEKSPQPLSNLASMGIYIFNRDILIQRLKEDAARPNSPHDFGFGILPGMVEKDRVFAYEFKGYWQDIGTVKAYYETNMELLTSSPSLNLHNPDWPIFTIERQFDYPDLTSEGIVSNSIVSSGCHIQGRVENSILSPGVHVAEHAVVRNTIVMSNTHIGYHSIIDRSILDENVNIGKFCYVGFVGSGLSASWDVTVIGKDVIVPANTGIGRNVRVQPRVKPHDFVTGLVNSGTMISSTRK